MTSSPKLLYLTFNDSPSGIYKSQVIDRLALLRSQGTNIQLVAFCTSQLYYKQKKQILNWDASAIVLKQLPGLRFWYLNLFKLIKIALKLNPNKIIGRSIYATNLALILRKFKLVNEVIYDGRGAIKAECDEFNIVPKKWLHQIESLERNAILNSDFQLAVSNALVQHWQEQFNFRGKNFKITPCTIGKDFENVEIDQKSILNARRKLGFQDDDVVLCYSGSLAGWQFKDGLENELVTWLELSKVNKLIFLCKSHQRIEYLVKKFKNQVKQLFVTPEEVPNYLITADYGLLVRDQNVTNKVASPVKFAEYLACGLKVIISEKIGDYSKMVNDLNLGLIYPSFKFSEIKKISFLEKNQIHSKSLEYFSLKSTFESLDIL